MIERPYVNKRGRLILGEGQKNYKETKRGRLGALLIPLAKAALSIFNSGKKIWQHMPANIHLASPYKQPAVAKRKIRRPRAAAAPATQQG